MWARQRENYRSWMDECGRPLCLGPLYPSCLLILFPTEFVSLLRIICLHLLILSVCLLPDV